MKRTDACRSLAWGGMVIVALLGMLSFIARGQVVYPPASPPQPASAAGTQPAQQPQQFLLPGQPPLAGANQSNPENPVELRRDEVLPPAAPANARAAADQPPAAPAQAPAAAAAAGQPAHPQTFSQAELDEMLAPIALYPDSLLSQVLMASTYPVEVVQADRWTRANPNLSGDALADALEQQPWDPSVKSLVNTPEVLAMMSDKLDWTVRLGDAFIGQQQQVMDTVQDLRRRAQEAGTLKNTPEQRVQTLVQAEPVASREIIIEQTNPDVVYVPVYDPYVCYGPWWHPNYRPFFWCPPTYPVGWSGIWFGLSYRCGAPWGYAWGHPDWHNHHFTVDVHRHERFNPHIDRGHFEQQIDRRDDRFHVDHGTWVHDPGHRKGVWYRDSNVAQRFGAPTPPPQLNRDRNAFRTRTATGTQGLMGPRVTTPSNAGRTTNTDGNTVNGIRDRQPQDRVQQSRQPVQAPGLKRDEPSPAGRDVRTRDSSDDNRVRQQPDDDNHGRQSDRVRIVRPEPTRVPSPDVSRDRGAAFSEVDRDGGSVRMESRRGTISRGSPEPGPSFRSEPAPSRSYSPPPSPAPSRSSGGDDGGGGRSSPAPAASHGNAPSRGR